MNVAHDLEDLHRRHATEIAARLGAHGEDADDGSIRGTVNKMATALRDWAGGLDEDALSFVRQGEEQLLAIYDAALEAMDDVGEDHDVVAMQAQDLRAKIAGLPSN